MPFFLVNNPEDDLLEGIFYLEAINAYGKESYHFSFEKFKLDWDPEPTIKPEPEDQSEPEPTSKMGGGTIAGTIKSVIFKKILIC